MRKLLFVIIYLAPFTCKAQDDKIGFPNPFQFQIIDSIQAKKDDLFLRAKTWIAKSYKDANSVIQLSDKDAGRLIGNAIMETTMSGFMGSYDVYQIHYTLSIDVKDNKFRFTLSDYYVDMFHHYEGISEWDIGSLDQEKPNLGISSKKRWYGVKEYAFKKSNDLMIDFISYMKNNQSDKW